MMERPIIKGEGNGDARNLSDPRLKKYIAFWQQLKEEGRKGQDLHGLLANRQRELGIFDEELEEVGIPLRKISSKDYNLDRPKSPFPQKKGSPPPNAKPEAPKREQGKRHGLFLLEWRRAVCSPNGPKPLARLLLSVLANYMRHDGTGAFPSQGRLSADSGLSLRTTKKHLRLAVKEKWITRERHINKDGTAGSYHYSAHMPVKAGVGLAAIPRASTLPQGKMSAGVGLDERTSRGYALLPNKLLPNKVVTRAPPRVASANARSAALVAKKGRQDDSS